MSIKKIPRVLQCIFSFLKSEYQFFKSYQFSSKYFHKACFRMKHDKSTILAIIWKVIIFCYSCMLYIQFRSCNILFSRVSKDKENFSKWVFICMCVSVWDSLIRKSIVYFHSGGVLYFRTLKNILFFIRIL